METRRRTDVYARAMSSSVERSFDAVLFDWCGTLVEYPLDEDRFRPVLQQLGRPHDDAAVTELVAAYRIAGRHPDAVEANKRCGLSAHDHRSTKLLICELAEIDHEFAGPAGYLRNFEISCALRMTPASPKSARRRR